MKVTQIHSIVNSAVGEITGKTDLVKEDLSNIVDIGKEVIDTDNLDNYVKKLINHIGLVVFDNRLYSGSVPSILMDSWEYGSILEKITVDIPTANENDSWKLENGKDYSQDVFYQPSVSAKFFNKQVTFEIPMSFTEKQVKESFSSVTQLNGFMSMLKNSVENAMTVKVDSLIMRTINNMVGETLAVATTAKVDLLALYNAQSGTTLTPDKALTDKSFIQFASYTISLYKDRVQKISTLFNVGGKERFTPEKDLHLVLLTDFAKASDVYLESDTYHNDKVSLPNYETVPYWQGSGKGYALVDTSAINVKTSGGKTVKQGYVLGAMFDTQALGVTNLDKRVTTAYNAKAEFFTNFYKFDSGYYNDLNENFVVFYMGVPATGG